MKLKKKKIGFFSDTFQIDIEIAIEQILSR